jgi:polygalacturonase
MIDIRNYGAKCDGKTDDKLAIDKAIKDIPKTGGILLFPPGFVCLTAGLHKLPSNTTIQAYNSAIIRKADPTLQPGGQLGHLFMALDGTENLRVSGGTYDLNRAAFADREKQGLSLSAFFLRRHSIAEFRDLTIRNGPENALKLWNVRDITVRNSRFINFHNTIIEFNNPKIDGALAGIKVPQCENHLIENNYFQDVDDSKNGAGNGVGVGAGAGSNSGQTLDNLHIYNNTFIGCNRAIWLETEGINNEMQHVFIIGNSIVGSITSTQTLYGIGLVGIRNGGIINNIIRNVGSTSATASDPSGITISGSATVESQDIIMGGNSILDLRIPPNNHTKWGIRLTRGKRLSVVNNLVAGANADQISINTDCVTNLKIAGNKCHLLALNFKGDEQYPV